MRGRSRRSVEPISARPCAVQYGLRVVRNFFRSLRLWLICGL